MTYRGPTKEDDEEGEAEEKEEKPISRNINLDSASLSPRSTVYSSPYHPTADKITSVDNTMGTTPRSPQFGLQSH